MFRLVRGREGPFDRSQNVGPNCWNFLEIFFGGRSVQSHVGAVWVDLCINLCFGIYRAGNCRKIRVH